MNSDQPRPAVIARPATLPHGSIDVRDVAHLSGLEFLEAWARGELPPPPIGRALNFALAEVAYGRTVFEGTPLRDFYNQIGSVHGSYAAALLDSAMGCAVHSCMAAGQGYTTLEYKISLVRGMSDATGRVRGEGQVLQVGRRVATAEGRLTDSAGRLLAHGTTTCLVFSP